MTGLANPTTMRSPDKILEELAVAHLALTALPAFIGLFGLVYLGLGAGMAGGAFGRAAAGAPPAAFGAGLMLVGGAIVLAAGAFAALPVILALLLRRRAELGLCRLIACLECLMAPFGTVLGIYTLIQLERPSLQSRFGPNPVPPPSIIPFNNTPQPGVPS